MSRLAAQSILFYGVDPTSELQDLAKVAVNLLHEVTAAEHEEDTDAAATSSWLGAYFKSASTLEGDSILAIVGRRGSGKTTLLTTICVDVLRADTDLLLPITRPESFRVTDSLISIFVSHVRDMMQHALTHQAAAQDNLGDRLLVLLQQVTKSAALSAPGTIDILNRNSDSVAQYALDAAGLIGHTDALVPLLRELLVHLRRVTGRKSDARIIFPFDDADLVPQRTVEILSDLRILSSLPGVVPLICVDENDLLRHLEADLQRGYGSAVSTTPLRQLARQQISKTIRPSNTISPPYLRHERRLRFTPLGESESLVSLIKGILERLDPRGDEWTRVAEWLDAAETPNTGNRVTGSTWLPETPRALENIWRVSRELLSALDGHHLWSVGPWLSTWLSALFDGPDYSLRTDVQSVESSDDGISISAAVAWTDVELGVIPRGQWQTVVDSSSIRVRLRRLSYPVLTRPDESKPKDSDATIDLGSQAASSLLLVQDVIRLSAFAEPKPVSPSVINHIDAFYLQKITIVGQNTDDRFFTFPSAEGGVYVTRSKDIWNQIVSDMRSAHRNDESKLELLVNSYVALVVKSWLGGQSTGDAVADGLPTLLATIDLAGTSYLRESRKAADAQAAGYNPSAAFCKWFETLLPWVYHELLIPRRILREVIETWLRYLSLAPRGTQGLDELRDNFRVRVETRVTQRRVDKEGLWMCGYLELFEQIDPDLSTAVEPLAQEYRTRRDRAEIGRAPTSETVVLNTESTSYPFAAEPTAEGVAEAELISAVLAQIRR